MGLYADYGSQEIHDAVIAQVQDDCGEVLPEGDERRIYTDSVVAVLVAAYADFDTRAKMRFLRWATGDYLDPIGEMYGCARLPAESAVCTLRFSVDAAVSWATPVPAGTLVSTPDGYTFATDSDAEIAAGDTSVDVAATAVEAGDAYNGYVAGTVTIIESAVEGVTSAANVDQTAGGSDGEVSGDEDGDERYRQRIMIAQNAVSVAGPAWSYRALAMAADADVADAQVPEPDTPCVIDVWVLKSGGGDFTATELAAIQAAVSADDVRPMCDQVTVRQAVADQYSISVSYTCETASEAATVEAIEGEGGAIDSYVEWQMGAIGRDVNPQRLMKLMLDAGAVTVDVKSPKAAVVSAGHYASCTGRTVSHSEYEDQ